MIISGGSFQFGFTTTPNSTFTVLATPDLSLPLSSWTAFGDVLETSPGQYRVTTPLVPGNPKRFYQLRSP
jgi:hypothetical protein